jgi:hypothetical protein
LNISGDSKVYGLKRWQSVRFRTKSRSTAVRTSAKAICYAAPKHG